MANQFRIKVPNTNFKTQTPPKVAPTPRVDPQVLYTSNNQGILVDKAVLYQNLVNAHKRSTVVKGFGGQGPIGN
jgi:hypothetical protein